MDAVRPYKVVLSDQRRIKEILHGIKLATTNETSQTDPESEAETNGSESAESENSMTTGCLTCKYEILKREDQIEHYKGDWHRYNLKLKLLGEGPISAEEFVDNSDIFSISGSDSDYDERHTNLFENSKNKTSMSVMIPDNEECHNAQLVNRRPKIYFKNSSEDIVSVYKKVLYSRRDSDSDMDIIQVASETLLNAFNSYWAVILLSAGHFAAGIFQGSKVLVHKTFHRYVVRAKRGVAQSLNDNMNKSSMAKSAGANLRRYNELQLEENIKTLLKSWKDEYIDNCTHIYLRFPQFRKTFFYGGKESPFDVKDSRIRSVPFVTRRPTFNEVQRVQQELFSLTVHGKKSMVDILSPPRPKSKANKNKPQAATNDNLSNKEDKMTVKELVKFQIDPDEGDLTLSLEPLEISTEHLETFSVQKKSKKKRKDKKTSEAASCSSTTEDGTRTRRKSQSHISPLEQLSPSDRDLVNKLYTACKTSDLTAFNGCFLPAEQITDKDHENLKSLLRIGIDASGNTLLHIAAKGGHKNIIYQLLERGSDPTLKNYQSFLPYCLCPNKEARNSFRRFRSNHPDLHDYTKAQVPAPLSEEREAELKQKQNEKKKAQRAARKEKEKTRKALEKKEKEERGERERFLGLSDREKRLIAIERRMKQDPSGQVTHTRRCFLCGDDMFAKVPFEYLDFQFCSVKCLKEHRALHR